MNNLEDTEDENITNDTKISTLAINKIKKVRKEKGFTQKDIADKLGISQVAYSKIEKGEVELGVDRFFLLLDFLGMENPFYKNNNLVPKDEFIQAFDLVVQQNQRFKEYFELELAQLNEKRRFIERLLGNSTNETNTN